jgi:hypothetical protein
MRFVEAAHPAAIPRLDEWLREKGYIVGWQFERRGPALAAVVTWDEDENGCAELDLVPGTEWLLGHAPSVDPCAVARLQVVDHPALFDSLQFGMTLGNTPVGDHVVA